VFVENASDHRPDILTRFGSVQRRKAFVDCLAYDVGECNASGPQGLRFAKSIRVKANIHQSRAHACKDNMYLQRVQACTKHAAFI
jgi:hypothetical protein